MKNLTTTLVICFSLLSFTILGQNKANIKGDSLLTDLVKNKRAAGVAAGYSVLGQEQWYSGNGYRDCKAKTAFEPNTITRIASIAKVMTTVAIMQLVEKGQINLDLPIQTYIPDFPKKAKGEITTRHLLQHSSGISAYLSNKERENKVHYNNLAAAVAIFKDRDLIAVPGKEHNYTSYGYVLLGYIIENVSKMAYSDYLQQNIWDVAGMINTGVESFETNPLNVSKLYHNQRRIKAAKKTDLSNRIPAGGIQSTVADLLKFGDAILNHTLITEESFNQMITGSGLKKEGNPHGFSLFLFGENPDLGNIVGHSGGQTGCSSMLFLLPDVKATVVVLSNTSRIGQDVGNLAVSLFTEVNKELQ